MDVKRGLLDSLDMVGGNGPSPLGRVSELTGDSQQK